MQIKRNQSWFFGIVIVLLLFFIFFMPSIGAKLRFLLGPQSPSPANADQLMAENESLSSKLSELSVVAGEVPHQAPDTILAMAYSDYPFNFKDEITVDAGSVDGVVAHDAVLFNGNLIGFISGLTAHRSVVQTIFDPDFKLQVRVGAKGYDALLAGGPYPMAESIVKTAVIAPGDVVYNAAPNAPYAVPVGTILNTSLAPDDLFEQASLSFPYDRSGIQAVEIVKQ
jgi:cell shape-determining protein MreC